LLTPKTPHTPYSNLATLWTLSVIHYLLQTGRGGFQLQECFSGYVWTCALHWYLIQACSFANLILLKYHYFSIIAVFHGLQMLSDRSRVHSLKNQQENKEIRSHITVFIA